MSSAKFFKNIGRFLDKLKLDDNKEKIHLIPFDDIVLCIKNEIKKGIDQLGDKTLVPNVINIYMSKPDKRKRLDREDIMIEELKKEIVPYCVQYEENFSKEILEIYINTDEKLTQGEFYVEASINRMNEKKELEILSEQLNLEESRKEKIYIELVRGTYKKEIPLDKNEYTIGRSEDADIKLEDPEKVISRVHCTIRFEDNKIFVISSGSNGTFIKSAESTELIRLPDEEKIEIYCNDILKIENYYLKLKRN